MFLSLNPIFRTVPLTFNELIVTLIVSSGVFWAVELEKFLKRRVLTYLRFHNVVLTSVG